MSRTLTHTDAHVLINAIQAEALGKNATITATDTSSFISAGETLLASGKENVFNAVAIVLGKRIAAVKPYRAQLKLIRAENAGIFTSRFSKISFYDNAALEDGSTNTQLFTNLADGFDNNTNPTNLGVAQSTMSQWVQNQKEPLEVFFGGSSTWQYAITVYDDQLQSAFRDEDSFNAFIMGYMMACENDIESEKEAFDRAALINFLAGIYDMSASMPGSAVDLTAEYNAKFGTSYTRADLLGTYYESFLKFFAARVKEDSKRFEERSVNYHWSVPKTVGGVTKNILRHTPRDRQKLIVLDDFWNDAEAFVMPTVFNPGYLKIENMQTIGFWQNENDRAGLSVTPAIPDTTDPTEQTTGSAVALDYVLGTLFDEDALMTSWQLETADTTAKEARKHYRNIWHTFRRNAINDFTEKAILYYMSDGEPEEEPVGP